MQKSRKKKGFTLTELAIVIAVIAILIAVLVPTFTSLINKARESSDSQLAKNMNTLLTTAEAEGNTPERMEDVNQILVNGGYTIAKLTPSADNNIFVWNEETNRISYVSTEDWTVIYAGDSSLTTDGTFTAANNYWVTIETASEISTWTGLSYYFGASISEDITFTADSSVDTGTYKLTGTLTYSSTKGAAAEQQTAKTAVNSVNAGKAATATSTTEGTATLRGTIATLAVENSSINVVNYASITTSATLTSVKTYTEVGSTKALTVTSGTVVVENNGYVDSLTLSSSSASLTNYGYIASLTNSSSATVTNSGYIVGNSDNSSYTYNISSYSELASFRDKVNNGTTFEGLTVELTADIDISNITWVPIGYDSRDNFGKTGYIYFAGIFNGNNHTIKGLTNTGFTPTVTRVDTYGTGSGVPEENNYLYGLFGILQGAEVNNVNLTNVNIVVEETKLDSVGAIAGFASGEITIYGCTVSGYIEATDAAGGILGRAYPGSNGNTITVTNCTNNCTVTTTGDKAAGIVGFCDPTKIGSGSNRTISITGCTNSGNITAKKYAAGISVAEGSSGYKVYTVTNCTNTGTISVTEDSSSSTCIGYIVGRGNAQTSNTEGSTWTISGCTSSFSAATSAATTIWDADGNQVTE